jgi:hypothetical protein
MRSFYLAVIFLFATSSAFLSATISAGAQVTQRNLLQSYVPALRTELIPQGDFHPFPQSPEAWRAILPDTTIRNIIKGGEDALHFEFRPMPATLTLEYVRTGNRVKYEKASFEKRNALCNLVYAEAMEGKGRFSDKILDGVWSICEESYWGLPAHLGMQKAGTGLPDVEDPTVDLFTAETAAVMAWTDYFAGATLERTSPLVRQRIYYEVNRRVFVPMQAQKYGYLGAGRSDVKLNNWAPWVMSNYLAAALVLEKDEARRIDAVERVMHYTDQYVNGLGDDGGCDEGPGYWSAAGACVLDVLDLLSDATRGKINLFHEPIIRKMGAYIYKTHIAGKYYINVADAAPEIVPDGMMLYYAGREMQDSVMMGFGSWIYHRYPAGGVSYEQFHRTRTLYDALVIKECAAYTPKEPAIKDCWFADVQLMVTRNDKGMFLASHGGHNAESHNHNDVGDFVVYAQGEPVIIDVGSGTYTSRTFSSHRYDLWFNTSAYHNLPVINGFQQKDGKEYAASDVKYEAGRNGTSLAMEIGKAYPAEAGIQSWRRTVKLDRTGNVAISDVYAMTKPLGSLTQTFMTVCHAELGGRGKVIFVTDAGERVWLDYDASVWDATVEKVAYKEPEDEGVRQHWDGRAVYRVLLKAVKLSTKGQLKYTIRAAE